MNTFQKVLIGYDGSTSAKAALQFAVGMAMDTNVELTALWVREPLPRYSDLLSEILSSKELADEYFQQLSEEIAQTSKAQGLDIHFITRAGNPAKTILQYADEGGYDLIVVGQTDHSELWGRLLGNTANRIVGQAGCRVLVINST